MCEFLAGVQGSDMPSIYVHLSGRDVDNAILRIYGKIPKDEGEEELRTKVCPRCGNENPSEADFCNRCRLPWMRK